MKTSDMKNISRGAGNEREENFSPAPCAGEKNLCANVGNHLGASSCKTAPLLYRNAKLIKPLRTAIDSLYLTFQGTIYPEIDEKLEKLKQIAGNKADKPTSEAFFKILDHQFEVRPSGVKNFAYVLQDNWYFIKISSSRATSLPLASVQISSELLTHQPLDHILGDLSKVISTIGHLFGEDE